jgi:hypothetical protein
MIAAMRLGTSVVDPFLGASIAQVGDKDTELFERIVQELLKTQSPETGLIHFGAGFLPLGDHFTTMWALALLAKSDGLRQHSQVVGKAIDGLARQLDFILGQSPDIIGFFLYVLLLLQEATQETKYLTLIDRCLSELIDKRETSWLAELDDLRMGGYVAFDLLAAASIRPAVMPFVEEWLRSAFDLEEESPTGLPGLFVTAQRTRMPDVWLQGWLRALIAAGEYLRLRQPTYSPAPAFFSNIFIKLRAVSGQLGKLQESVDRVVRYRLGKFHEVAPRDKSVLVIERTEGNPHQLQIREAISEGLAEAGLVMRHVGDRRFQYLPDAELNDIVYLQGCKYAVMVFDALPLTMGAKQVLPPGMPAGGSTGGEEHDDSILAIYDEDRYKGERPEEDTAAWKAFRSAEPGLSTLKRIVANWASGKSTPNEDW